jgi:hypothetical protein
VADDTRHDRHDREAIAAAADRMGPARFAQALLAACTDCARLYADLQALAVALPATATPARPRDFTLSTADAERLRPRGLRHWFGLIGSARDTVTRPLAVGLTTLGLAGLLVATVPGGLSMGSGAGASAAPAEAPAAGAPASPESLQLSAAPAATVDDGGVFSGSDSGDPAPTTDRTTTQPAPAEVATPDDQDATLLTIGGLLTLAGLGLFALRRSAQSLARD